MRQISRATPPNSYALHRSAQDPYSSFSSDPEIREALLDEQSGFCAYCERPLNDLGKTRIEHFHPQNGNCWTSDCEAGCGTNTESAAATSWTNLLLCCDGNENAGRDFTCDKAKENRDICKDFRNPKVTHLDQLVTVERDGKVYAATSLPAEAQGVLDNVLNLNQCDLVAARKSVMIARIKLVKQTEQKHHGLTIKMRQNIVDKLRQDATNSEFATTLLSLADHIEKK